MRAVKKSSKSKKESTPYERGARKGLTGVSGSRKNCFHIVWKGDLRSCIGHHLGVQQTGNNEFTFLRQVVWWSYKRTKSSSA